MKATVQSSTSTPKEIPDLQKAKTAAALTLKALNSHHVTAAVQCLQRLAQHTTNEISDNFMPRTTDPSKSHNHIVPYPILTYFAECAVSEGWLK